MAKEEKDDLTNQILNMVLENNAIRERVYPLATVYIVFNIIILFVLLYIAIKVSIK
jgi:hypothetical protein